MSFEIFNDLRTIGQIVAAQARTHPDAIGLEVVDQAAISYSTLYRRSSAFASQLRTQGVQRGDMVVVMLKNGFDALYAAIGLSLLGATDVSINTAYIGSSFEHALNIVQARHLIIDSACMNVLRASAPNLKHLEHAFICAAADGPDAASAGRIGHIQLHTLRADAVESTEIAPTALQASEITNVIFTSGTSGPAKAVLLPAFHVYFLVWQTCREISLTSDDVMYCSHPLFHMAGKFMQVYAAFLKGARMVLAESFRPENWIHHIHRHKVSATLLHGPMLEMIFAQPETEYDARTALSKLMVAPLPKTIAPAFRQRFAVRTVDLWGMTEVGIPLWCPLGGEYRPGSCGKAQDEFDVQIVDPDTDVPVPAGTIGEIVIRGKLPWLLMQGYMGMPDKSVESWRNLWFHTGDAAYMDEDGYVFYIDRLKDRIRRKGENISSYDIESAALLHDHVKEAAAVSVPSEYEFDDEIKLCVVVAEGRTLAPEEILEFLAPRIPHFMIPRYVEFLDELPRTPTNKIQKVKLRQGTAGKVWDRKAAGISVRRLVEETRRP